MHQTRSTFFVALRQAQGDNGLSLSYRERSRCSCHGERAEPCTNQGALSASPFGKLRVTVGCSFLTGKAAGALVMVSLPNHEPTKENSPATVIFSINLFPIFQPFLN
jgi:hypothetical protein